MLAVCVREREGCYRSENRGGKSLDYSAVSELLLLSCERSNERCVLLETGMKYSMGSILFIRGRLYALEYTRYILRSIIYLESVYNLDYPPYVLRSIDYPVYIPGYAILSIYSRDYSDIVHALEDTQNILQSVSIYSSTYWLK